MRTERKRALDVFAERMRDPVWLAGRLTIVTKSGETRRLEPRFEEQRSCAEAFRTHHNILVEKPRQIGSTTEWVALFTALMISRGLAQRSYNVLAVMHEYASVARFTQQVRTHIEFLPAELRPQITFENTKEVAFRIGRTEAYFKTTMAGGRGQGRSRTFQGALLSEAGRYPRGSSAQGGRQGVDEEAYAAIVSTMPTPEVEPWARLVIESTCGPPTGLFYNLIKRAQDPDIAREWAFLFFPWYKFKQYQRPWQAGASLSADEAALLAKFAPLGMTLENIGFRRNLIQAKGYSERMFRQEYPTTWDEPFLLSTSMWFDLERIAALIAAAPKKGQGLEGLRQYHKFAPGHMYFVGVDAAGGTGGDWSVITVTRDDAQVAAVWSANNVAPRGQGDMTHKLSLEYGGAIANVEVGNVWGRAVWKRCRELGCPLWTTPEGREFVTDPRTKAVVMDWMKHLVQVRFATLNDLVLLEECNHVREQLDGTIAADQGYHDDHVMSCALSLWAARSTITAGWRSKPRSGTMAGPQQFDLAVELAELEKRMEGKRWKP